MPKYYEDKEEDNRACAGIREDFKACLLQHDCVVKEGKMPSECLKEGHCKALQTSFFECKRSMSDQKPNKTGIILKSKAGHKVEIQRTEGVLRNHLKAYAATWLKEC